LHRRCRMDLLFRGARNGDVEALFDAYHDFFLFMASRNIRPLMIGLTGCIA
jgi:hypothetical protein